MRLRCQQSTLRRHKCFWNTKFVYYVLWNLIFLELYKFFVIPYEFIILMHFYPSYYDEIFPFTWKWNTMKETNYVRINICSAHRFSLFRYSCLLMDSAVCKNTVRPRDKAPNASEFLRICSKSVTYYIHMYKTAE